MVLNERMIQNSLVIHGQLGFSNWSNLDWAACDGWCETDVQYGFTGRSTQLVPSIARGNRESLSTIRAPKRLLLDYVA
jgi:hypothetical protein